jgi:hypothetical protein
MLRGGKGVNNDLRSRQDATCFQQLDLRAGTAAMTPCASHDCGWSRMAMPVVLEDRRRAGERFFKIETYGCQKNMSTAHFLDEGGSSVQQRSIETGKIGRLRRL